MQNDDKIDLAAPIARRTWNTPRIILSELGDTQKFSNAMESPRTAFSGRTLTNQGPS